MNCTIGLFCRSKLFPTQLAMECFSEIYRKGLLQSKQTRVQFLCGAHDHAIIPPFVCKWPETTGSVGSRFIWINSAVIWMLHGLNVQSNGKHGETINQGWPINFTHGKLKCFPRAKPTDWTNLNLYYLSYVLNVSINCNICRYGMYCYIMEKHKF